MDSEEFSQVEVELDIEDGQRSYNERGLPPPFGRLMTDFKNLPCCLLVFSSSVNDCLVHS